LQKELKSLEENLSNKENKIISLESDNQELKTQEIKKEIDIQELHNQIKTLNDSQQELINKN
jgi:hypothetical protein